MKKTLIALAVAGTAALPFAYANDAAYRGGTHQQGLVVTGETESGPVFSVSQQLSGMYDPTAQNVAPNTYASDMNGAPVVTGSVAPVVEEPSYSSMNEIPVTPSDASSIGGASSDPSASVSRTWFFPDGTVAYDSPSLSMSGVGSDNVPSSPSQAWIIGEAQPDDLLIYGR